MPPAATSVLERLQDQIPALSGQRARELAYATWPGGRDSFDATFANVDWTPIAAAVLGQVHRATLRRDPNKQFDNINNTTRRVKNDHNGNIGTAVAVKLQRTYLKESTTKTLPY